MINLPDLHSLTVAAGPGANREGLACLKLWAAVINQTLRDAAAPRYVTRHDGRGWSKRVRNEHQLDAVEALQNDRLDPLASLLGLPRTALRHAAVERGLIPETDALSLAQGNGHVTTTGEVDEAHRRGMPMSHTTDTTEGRNGS